MITDFEKVLAVFTQHQIEFIVIGGVAGTLHGSAFITQDLDVVYSRTPENIRRLASALQPHSP